MPNAITKISDVIVPELFEPYVTKRTAEKSAIFQSGIITNDFIYYIYYM